MRQIYEEDPMNLVPLELRPLIPGFLERREKEVQDLQQMLRAENFSAIRDVGHKLKGTGAGYGFQLLSDLGRTLETAAGQKNLQELQKTVEQLAIVTTNLKEMLKQRTDF